MADATSFRARLRKLLKEVETELEDAELDEAISNGLKRMDQKLPNITSYELTSDGSGCYNLPDDFTKFSRLLGIEYPEDEEPPTYLDEDYFEVDSAKNIVCFSSGAPASGDKFELYFTKTWTLADLPSDYEEPALWISAYFALRFLSVKYARSVSSSLSADSVAWSEKVDLFDRLAKEYEAQFEKFVKRPVFSQTVQGLGEKRQRITHPRRFRRLGWRSWH